MVPFLLKVIFLFLLDAFKIFSLCLVFSSYTMMSSGMGVLYLSYLGFETVLRSFGLKSCKVWGKS